MTETTTLDLTTATPAEIDTVLADLYEQAYRHEMAADLQYHEIRRWVGRQGFNGPSYRAPKANPAEVARYFEALTAKDESGQSLSYDESALRGMRVKWETEQAAYLAAVDAQAPYHAEFRRRGGWTRAFLVTNAGGHVHKDRSCSTCFPSTHYAWLPQVSGLSEVEIVDRAGERACTVCYPSAPVESLSKPTQFFTPDEQAKAARKVEREAKAAQAKAAQITVTGVQGWTNDGRGQHTYKTVRGATNAIAGYLGSLCWYGPDHPSAAEWLNNVAQIREALAAKGVEYDYDKALAAARKKVQRDGGGKAKF